MRRLKIVHNLKTAVWLFIVTLLPISAIGLYWANQTGLPDDWRKAIEVEISKHGAHVELGSLTYVPLEGFVARGVRIFADKERVHEISRLERVQLALDYANLAGGKFRLRKAILKNAHLSLPVDPDQPDGESLYFTKINGTIFMPNERLVEVKNASAQVGGVDLTLSLRLLGKSSGEGRSEKQKNEGRRREMVAKILEEMDRWDFGSEETPSIRVQMEGDLSDKETFKAAFEIEAPSVARNQYSLTNLTATGSLSGYLLTISSFEATDSRGLIGGSIDYQILNRNGRFDMRSSIDIPRLVNSWTNVPIKIDLLSGGTQQLEFAGQFDLTDLTNPKVNMTGHAFLESFIFRGIPFDSLDTSFSLQNGDFFLQNMKLERPDGIAKGKVLKKQNIVRIQLDSTLPANLYKPLFIGKPLEKIIDKFGETDESSVQLFLDGSIDTRDRRAWAFKGNGTVTNLSFNGVPLNSANCSFILNRDVFDFFDGEVDFNYSNYSLKETYNGPSNGKSSVGRIVYNRPTKTVGVEAVEGNIWAAPLIRLFAPAIADNIEKYKFHTTPYISGSGIVDVTPQGRTNLNVDFSSQGEADYKFLGENITLSSPKGKVGIKGREVRISDLTANVFGGPITIGFDLGKDSKIAGEVSWSKLSLQALSSTYDFKLKGGGEITGRLEFTMLKNQIETMNGKGLVALEDAALFSVPIFGPLSGVISAVLDDEKVGFEKATSAFCTFKIRDGLLSTKDFQSATNSVIFAGDGAVDLKKKSIDFTIRLNARGLLGLITLPLRPFYGLFQFRGTGPLKDTVWENVHFTSPPEELNEILLAPPPKAKVVPE
ncbi:MAG: AsmA-like C-terminal region-containing protein [Akkermansiaceae bacterium]